MGASRTIWILGDQLNMGVASLDDADPATDRILMIRSEGKVASKPFHPLRLRLVQEAMEAFAGQLRDRGFRVDHRTAATFAEGVEAHRRRYRPDVVRAMEPMSWDGLRTMERLRVETVRSGQFLCHRDEFAAWAGERSGRRLVMEDFYRRQRVRLGYLMDGDEPAGGRWNFDRENREPPPRDAGAWPRAGRDVAWPVTRRQALARLRSFVAEVLPRFGPHQDAMVRGEWRLAHSLLSSSMNIGLLHPREVCDAVEEAYRAGEVPIASAEGFIRQVIGWREYVWGAYWLWMPGFRRRNGLGARRPLPPAFRDGPQATRMACVAAALEGVRDHAYAHHIQRLMVLGNLALLAGVRPREMVDWMWASFIDGAEWVMIPNVVGMALHADGGRMMTKPYAAGGAYIDRMSDHCGGCPYDPRRRTGDDACPFTTLYWDFLARHRDRFAGNGRMRQQVRGLERLRDLPEVRERAAEVLRLLDAGKL
ncbi:MAG: cryptochrome/photolyase family protein [Thermoleophilia bacterium]